MNTVLALAMVATVLGITGESQAGGVSIGINVGPPPVVVVPPPVVVAAPPALVVVPGSPVFYAPAVSANFFFYGGRYYTYHGANWFYARAYNGPWVFAPVHAIPAPVLAVPVAYYKVPPGHWKKGGPPTWAGSKHGKWKGD
jgi:hypothetical protein